MPTRPVYDNITAHAGGGQSAATALQEGINRVTTVATAADSVILPSTQDVTGEEVIVINAAAANSMNVFPSTGEAINALAANAAFAIAGAAGKAVIFYVTGPGRWHSVPQVP